MRIKSKTISIIYKLVLIAISIYGLVMEMGLYNNTFNWKSLNYFTNISNILCLIYITISLINVIKKNNEHTWNPTFRGVCTLAITLTFIMANFMQTNIGDVAMLSTTPMVLLHKIVPVMFVLNWLLFDVKGKYHSYDPWIWLIPEVIYLVYVMVAAHFGTGVGIAGRYPYPFMDYEALGIKLYVMNLLMVLLILLASGYLYYSIDHAMRKRH